MINFKEFFLFRHGLTRIFLKKGVKMKKFLFCILLTSIFVIMGCDQDSKPTTENPPSNQPTVKSEPKIRDNVIITVPANTEYEVLDKEIFGIRLGERLEDVKKRHNVRRLTNSRLARYDYDFLSKNIKRTMFFVYEGQVSSILVDFLDFSNYGEVIKSVKDKYNIIESKTLDNGYQYVVEIDGKKVEIQITLSGMSMADTELSIAYIYVEMRNDERAVLKQERAFEIKEINKNL